MKLAKAITAAALITAFAIAPANAGHDKEHKHGGNPQEQTAVSRAARGGGVIEARVNGLVCDFCALSIRKVFLRTGAVEEADVNLKNRKVTVYLKEGENLTDEAVKNLLKDSGYSTVSISRHSGERDGQ